MTGGIVGRTCLGVPGSRLREGRRRGCAVDRFLPSSLLWHFGRYGWGAACRVVGLARRHDLHYVTIPISLPATPIVLLVAT